VTRVGIVTHHSKPEAAELAGRAGSWLSGRGHEVVEAPTDPSGLDLLLVLGGDGTMLHGIGLAGFAGVPVLGVNLGQLGFLTEVGADDLFEALERVLAGDHTVDLRSTVEASVRRADGSTEPLGEGMNEVALERAVGGKLIRMSLVIGGQPFTSFGADGLIVATPTGSTAYAFSMRGPVVSPEHRALIVVAVGAHSLFDRPLVVSEDQPVEVSLLARGEGVVVMDGRPRAEVAEGDVLTASIGRSVVRLIRLGPDSHFTRVARRFGLPPA